jgi:hypothetical protein
MTSASLERYNIAMTHAPAHSQGRPILLAIESVDFFLRNLRMRLPFRYGKACLVASPLLHVRLRARGVDGAVVEGVSADILPPKWFDKAPEKDYRRNIEDLLAAAIRGARNYREFADTPRSAFDIWQDAYPRTLEHGAEAGLNGLTSSFGSSIIERALIDAACHLAGTDFHTLLKRDGLGVEPGAVHAELAGKRLADAIPNQPSESILIRHTVGLSDALTEADVPTEDRLNDCLPVSLDAWIKTAGMKYFKIKVGGVPDTDFPRLQRITDLLEAQAAPDYRVSLDGNEQFPSGAALRSWLEELGARPALRPLLQRVLFIEQPMDRAVALTESGAQGFAGLEGMPPIAIDESDDALDSLKRAVALGYRGTSVKNCKGVFKALLNKMLIDHYNERNGGGYLLTGEDLSNQPVVPLQQDLCTLSVLGLAHAERNGHHYGGTLNLLSPRELAECLDVHAALYEPFGASGRVRIREGRLDLRSLRGPGYGVGISTDFDNMTPVHQWTYESLGLGA